jgi:hypothetical protein
MSTKFLGITTSDLNMLRNRYVREAAAWQASGNADKSRYWSEKAGLATQEIERRENHANRRD